MIQVFLFFGARVQINVYTQKSVYTLVAAYNASYDRTAQLCKMDSINMFDSSSVDGMHPCCNTYEKRLYPLNVNVWFSLFISQSSLNFHDVNTSDLMTK